MASPAKLASDQKWDQMKAAIANGSDPNEVNKPDMGYTPLLYACYHNENDVFSWLIQHGADVNICDNNKKCAMHIAAKYGSPDCIRTLLLNGAITKQKDKFNRLPVDLVSDRRGAAKTVSQEALDEVKQVIDTWEEGKLPAAFNNGTLQDLAAQEGVVGDEAAALLRVIGGGVSRKKVLPNPAVHPVAHAAKQEWGHMKNAIMEGGDPNEKELSDSMQYTPLMYAAYHDSADSFAWLVQSGAAISCCDTNRKNALHVAAKYGSPNVVRLLLIEGVDPDQKDKFGRVPRELLKDRRGTTKEVTAVQLNKVDQVFELWPQVKPFWEAGTLEAGLDKGGDLAEEVGAYIALLNPKSSQTAQPPAGPSAAAPAPSAEAPKGSTAANVEEDLGEGSDVFMSYCWAQKDVVRPLAALLQKAGIKVWLDVQQMKSGESLFEEIDKGLRNTALMLSCISQEYSRSVNCRREVVLATELKKPILPLIVDQSQFKHWPPTGPMGPLLSGKLYVDLKQPQCLTQVSEGMQNQATTLGTRLQQALPNWPTTPWVDDTGAVPECEVLARPDDAADIFISYSWANKGIVRPFAAWLKQQGHRIWLDIEQMMGGNSLFEKIDLGVRHAHVVIAFVSPEYAISLNCRISTAAESSN